MPYEKRDWNAGEVITESRIDRMEQGIEDAHTYYRITVNSDGTVTNPSDYPSDTWVVTHEGDGEYHITFNEFFDTWADYLAWGHSFGDPPRILSIRPLANYIRVRLVEETGTTTYTPADGQFQIIVKPL